MIYCRLERYPTVFKYHQCPPVMQLYVQKSKSEVSSSALFSTHQSLSCKGIALPESSRVTLRLSIVFLFRQGAETWFQSQICLHFGSCCGLLCHTLSYPWLCHGRSDQNYPSCPSEPIYWHYDKALVDSDLLAPVTRSLRMQLAVDWFGSFQIQLSGVASAKLSRLCHRSSL